MHEYMYKQTNTSPDYFVQEMKEWATTKSISVEYL